VIQIKGKGRELTQLSQFPECRDVLELLIVITINGVELIQQKGKGGEVTQFSNTFQYI
jgi:hypothetical protein